MHARARAGFAPPDRPRPHAPAASRARARARTPADNNIGRNCYRIGQIQRAFSAALRAIEAAAGAEADWAAPLAPHGAPAAAEGGADGSGAAARAEAEAAALRARGLALVLGLLGEPPAQPS